jgi:hypothetical protein
MNAEMRKANAFLFFGLSMGLNQVLLLSLLHYLQAHIAFSNSAATKRSF